MASPGPLRLTCKDVIGMLMDYLEATLRPETLGAFNHHLASCPQCVAYIATYRKTRQLTAKTAQVEMPDDMKRRLRDLLLAHLSRPG
jgi:anti-sigma factor RsiW